MSVESFNKLIATLAHTRFGLPLAADLKTTPIAAPTTMRHFPILLTIGCLLFYRVALAAEPLQAGEAPAETSMAVLGEDKPRAIEKLSSRTWTDAQTAAKEFEGFDAIGEYHGGDQGLQVTPAAGRYYFSFYDGGLPGAGWDGNAVSHAWHDLAEARKRLQGFDKQDRSARVGASPPPEGAVVLFDGSDNQKPWAYGEIKNGLLQAGAKTKRSFRDFKLHCEFLLPLKPDLPISHPDRGNSGIFALGAYELQLVDTFALDLTPSAWQAEKLLKHPDTACGSIYGLYSPSVNMCLPPLVWQSLDVELTAAHFNASGKKTEDARMTVSQNGVGIHNNVALARGTGGGPSGPRAEVATGQILFQKHGNPTQFRNVWVIPR